MHTIIILSIVSLLSSSTHCMYRENRESIVSADGYTCPISQDTIDSSRSLVFKQMLREKLNVSPSYPIKTNANKEGLDLFCGACSAKDSFDRHFESLKPAQRSLLMTVAGKQQLDSPEITVKILNFYTLQPITTPVFKQHMEVEDILNYLRYRIIRQKVRKSAKTSKQCKRSFSDKCIAHYNSKNKWHLIPLCILNNKKSHLVCPQDLFNGHIPKKDSFFLATFGEQPKTLCGYQRKNPNTSAAITYFLTATNKKSLFHQNGDEKKVRLLFTENGNKDIIYKKKIRHHNNISKTGFCPNGRYLASYSARSNKYAFPTLLITTLGTNQGSDYTDMILPIECSAITQFCFNPQSTFFICGAQHKNNDTNTIDAALSIWDPSNGECKALFSDMGESIETILLNNDGTRMFLSYTTHDGQTKCSLWNTERLPDMTRINDELTLSHNDYITQHPQFNHAGTALVIPTKDGSFYFINSIDGTIVSQHSHKIFRDTFSYILFTPNDKFCIVATAKMGQQKQQDTVSLWDANKGVLIRHLLQKQKDLNGIGLTPDLKYAVATFYNKQMTLINLIDDHSLQCLNWIQNHASLSALYALYHACQAHQENRCPSQEIMHKLKQLPKTPCNVLSFVATYLLPAGSLKTMTGNHITP